MTDPTPRRILPCVRPCVCVSSSLRIHVSSHPAPSSRCPGRGGANVLDSPYPRQFGSYSCVVDATASSSSCVISSCSLPPPPPQINIGPSVDRYVGVLSASPATCVSVSPSLDPPSSLPPRLHFQSSSSWSAPPGYSVLAECLPSQSR